MRVEAEDAQQPRQPRQVAVDDLLEVRHAAKAPIPLKPGRHSVKYTNPYFSPVEHEVVVDEGQTVHDRATLSEPIAVTEDTETAP